MLTGNTMEMALILMVKELRKHSEGFVFYLKECEELSQKDFVSECEHMSDAAREIRTEMVKLGYDVSDYTQAFLEENHFVNKPQVKR